MEAKLEAALDEICGLRSDVWDGDLCEPFLEVPDRHEYATYYDTIKTPIAIVDIRRRLQQLGYGRSVSKFAADFELMTQNATVFNQEVASRLVAQPAPVTPLEKRPCTDARIPLFFSSFRTYCLASCRSVCDRALPFTLLRRKCSASWTRSWRTFAARCCKLRGQVVEV